VRHDALSCIEERMPPATSEKPHRHARAEQFFYVLDGVASMYFPGRRIAVRRNEGIHISPGTRHYVSNEGATDLRFLLVSRPTTKGDREEIAAF
jgi:mannose-6-phosphate isomerase-like protein (cupin superfamily)